MLVGLVLVVAALGGADGFFKNAKGRIQIQDHGSKVWFLDLKLRVLDGRQQPVEKVKTAGD